MSELQESSRSGRFRPLLSSRKFEPASLDSEIDSFLKEIIPNHWRNAAHIALETAEATEFLTWSDRAARLDAVIWEQARFMLSNDQITAVINRLTHSHGHCYAVLEYSTFVSAVVSATLMRLDEQCTITSTHHALTLALSKVEEHQAKARDWMRSQNSVQPLECALSKLPGYSFALMTVYSSDTAESFIARDAFWRAMLGG